MYLTVYFPPISNDFMKVHKFLSYKKCNIIRDPTTMFSQHHFVTTKISILIMFIHLPPY